MKNRVFSNTQCDIISSRLRVLWKFVAQNCWMPGTESVFHSKWNSLHFRANSFLIKSHSYRFVLRNSSWVWNSFMSRFWPVTRQFVIWKFLLNFYVIWIFWNGKISGKLFKVNRSTLRSFFRNFYFSQFTFYTRVSRNVVRGFFLLKCFSPRRRALKSWYFEFYCSTFSRVL